MLGMPQILIVATSMYVINVLDYLISDSQREHYNGSTLVSTALSHLNGLEDPGKRAPQDHQSRRRPP
jgi:hypothetical protein